MVCRDSANDKNDGYKTEDVTTKLATKYKVETRLQNQNRIKVTRLNLFNHVLWAIKNSKVFKNIRTVGHHE